MKIAIASLSLLLLPPFLAAARPEEQCSPQLRDVLRAAGEYGGPLVCSKKDATFVRVGVTAASHYTIYNYRYRFLPHPAGVMHGGQRLYVFRGKTYLGQYMLPPVTTVTLEGAHVVLRKDRQSARFDFSRRPPEELLFDGEINRFGR